MKTVVLGATGYLGSHVAQQLAEAGNEVVCLVRANSNTDFLKTLVDLYPAFSLLTVDYNDDEALLAAMKQAEMVLNCIADTRMHISDEERRKIEITLTGRLFVLADRAGAKRFLQLSTVMVYGFDRPSSAIDENYTPNPKYGYARIALEREQQLLALHESRQIELVILRPVNTLGKRDGSALPAILEGHSKGIFPVVSGGHWSYSCMDARDVGRAMAHLLAVDIDKPEVFLVGAYEMTWLELKEGLDLLLNKPSKVMNIPKSVGMFIGRLLEIIYPFGSNPPLSRFSVEVISTDALFNDQKLRNTGFKSNYTLMDTLHDALDVPVIA